MTNITEALVAFLKADSAVLALVGTSVYGVEIPPKKAPDMPAKTVTIRPEGGPTNRGTVPVYRPRFEFWSTAETFLEAMEIDGAVYDALVGISREDVSGVGIYAALPAAGARASREATTGWRAMVRAAEIVAEDGRAC